MNNWGLGQWGLAIALILNFIAFSFTKELCVYETLWEKKLDAFLSMAIIIIFTIIGGFWSK